MKKDLITWGGILAAALSFVGCTGYDVNARQLRTSWSAGDITQANKITGDALTQADSSDLLIWQLEHGTTLKAAGETKQALMIFEQADQTVRAWDDTPEILLSQEILAGLTNPSVLPYRGRSSDIIMLHTYRALSFLELGETETARVALNAAYQAQRDAVERNEKAIASARKEADENAVDTKKILADSGLEQKIAEQRNAISEVRILSDYVNPFTTWLHGIYFLSTGTDASDFERAKLSLERVSKMYPENPYIAEDLKCATEHSPEKSPITYIVFESGLAPRIGVNRVDTIIPIPIGSGDWTLIPFSLALPKLELSAQRKYWLFFPAASGSYSSGDATPTAIPSLSVNNVPASEVCDMNSIVRTDFENAYPAVLTRTLITATLKSTAAATVNIVGTKIAQKNNNIGGFFIWLATILGTSIYTSGSTDADTRCWQTLPQNFSIVRIPTPSNGKLKIRIDNQSCDVELRPAQINLVHVKTIHENSVPHISQSVLKP